MRFWSGNEGIKGSSARGWPTVLIVVVLAAGWLVAGCGGPAESVERCGPIRFVNGQSTEPKVVVVLLDGGTSQEKGGKFYPVPVANPANGMPMVTSYCPIDPNGKERSRSNGWPDGLNDGLRRWSEFQVPWTQLNPAWKPPPATFACEDHKLVPAGNGGGSVEMDGALHQNKDRDTCLVARLADAGAVLLPYSYAGATLSQQPSGPVFDFHTYDGFTTLQEPSISIQKLDEELSSIHTVWNQAHIVVVGHSVGGLIAEQWWRCIVGHCGVALNDANAGESRGVVHVFSLDSAINGVRMTRCDEKDPIFQGAMQLDGKPLAALWCTLWLGQNELDRESLAWERTAAVPYTPIGVPDDPAYSGEYGDVGNIQSQVLYNSGCDHTNRQCIAQPPSYVLGAPNAPGCIGSGDIYGTTGHDTVKVCPQVVKFIACSVQAARDNGNQQDCYPTLSSRTPTASTLSATPTHTDGPLVPSLGSPSRRLTADHKPSR